MENPKSYNKSAISSMQPNTVEFELSTPMKTCEDLIAAIDDARRRQKMLILKNEEQTRKLYDDVGSTSILIAASYIKNQPFPTIIAEDNHQDHTLEQVEEALKKIHSMKTNLANYDSYDDDNTTEYFGTQTQQVHSTTIMALQNQLRETKCDFREKLRMLHDLDQVFNQKLFGMANTQAFTKM